MIISSLPIFKCIKQTGVKLAVAIRLLVNMPLFIIFLFGVHAEKVYRSGMKIIFFICDWELLTRYNVFSVIKMLFSYTIFNILLDGRNYLY